ncbi:hypothetical protein KKB40_04810 [Patescibacteria group bacterium]|nr:hypothetical protein [Patescibacteria group bacterium]
MFKKILISLILFLVVFGGKNVFAQNDLPREETLEARVEKILDEGEIQLGGMGQEKQLYQKLELVVTKGSLAGESVIIENGNFPSVNIPKYRVGDKLIVTHNKDFEGNDIFLFLIMSGVIPWFCFLSFSLPLF